MSKYFKSLSLILGMMGIVMGMGCSAPEAETSRESETAREFETGSNLYSAEELEQLQEQLERDEEREAAPPEARTHTWQFFEDFEPGFCYLLQPLDKFTTTSFTVEFVSTRTLELHEANLENLFADNDLAPEDSPIGTFVPASRDNRSMWKVGHLENGRNRYPAAKATGKSNPLLLPTPYFLKPSEGEATLAAFPYIAGQVEQLGVSSAILWDLRALSLVTVYSGPNPTKALALTPEGTALVATGYGDKFYLVDTMGFVTPLPKALIRQSNNLSLERTEDGYRIRVFGRNPTELRIVYS